MNEIEIVNDILQNYPIKVQNISKKRSVYKISCDDHNYCLKKMQHGLIKVHNGFILVEELHKNGFNKVPAYIKTKDSKMYVKRGKYIFYMTEWIDGEECDINNFDEAINCAKFLAEFHLATEKIDIKELTLRSNLKNWPKIFRYNLNDLEKYKNAIKLKRIKNEFDVIYEESIDDYFQRGLMSLKLLNDSNYYNFINQNGKGKTLCHDSFYYQNIINKEGQLYLIDLDSAILDLHVNDLGKFIRRTMFKKDYAWDFNKAKTLIEAYNSIKRLSYDELEIMLALIIFPHKFWKLGKKRYKKHKNWNENKYMNKLNKIIKYNELQRDFLENYLKYMSEVKNGKL